MHCIFTFHLHMCFIQNQLGNLIGGGERKDGLYILNLDDHPSRMQVAEAKSSSVPIDLWHHRLGHLADSRLIHFHLLDSNIPQHSKFSCEICPASKQRLPFPTSQNKTTRLFQLIHMDIQEKSSLPTHHRFNYFLTIVDDYSCATWVFLLINKFETCLKLKHFIIDVKNNHDSTIHTIRSDNGGEFTSTDVLQLMRKNGILHQLSCSYTPQQNGRVKRKHKHLLQVDRSLFQSKVPLRSILG